MSQRSIAVPVRISAKSPNESEKAIRGGMRTDAQSELYTETTELDTQEDILTSLIAS